MEKGMTWQWNDPKWVLLGQQKPSLGAFNGFEKKKPWPLRFSCKDQQFWVFFSHYPPISWLLPEKLACKLQENLFVFPVNEYTLRSEFWLCLVVYLSLNIHFCFWNKFQITPRAFIPCFEWSILRLSFQTSWLKSSSDKKATLILLEIFWGPYFSFHVWLKP